MSDSLQYERFLHASREAQRLEFALEACFEPGLTPEQRETCLDYVLHHLRPALDFLADTHRTDRIETLMREGLISPEDLTQLIHRKEDASAPLQWLLLENLKRDLSADLSFDQQRGKEDSKSPKNTTDAAAAALLRGALLELYGLFPFLDAAISALKLQPGLPSSDVSGSLIATDGKCICCDPPAILKLASSDPLLLRRTLSHVLLHCCLGHVTCSHVPQGRGLAGMGLGRPPEEDTALFHAAADIHIEFLMERACRRISIRQMLGSLPIPGSWTGLFERMGNTIWTPEQIVREVPRQTILELGRTLARDDHSLWSPDPALQRQWQLLARSALHRETEAAADREKCELHAGDRIPGHRGPGESRFGASGFGIGTSPGTDSLPAGVIAKGTYDYRSFLHRFCVFREELQIDPGSFDLIYYTLGMQRYGNMPLLEPLETREGYRLEELVIAIDTSGSCETPMVYRFLEETRAILEEKELFFRGMNVWILQCDCIVQSAVNIRSRTDWDAYLRDLCITGRSGTDFRPVFRYVDRLRQEGKLRDLKALIYFTDGDGVFPREAPPYETAFVFVEEPDERLHIPSWANRIVVPQND